MALPAQHDFSLEIAISYFACTGARSAFPQSKPGVLIRAFFLFVGPTAVVLVYCCGV